MIWLLRAFSNGVMLFTPNNPFAPEWVRTIGSGTERSPENTRKKHANIATQTQTRGKESTLRAKCQRQQRRNAVRSEEVGAAVGDGEPPVRRLFFDKDDRPDDGMVPNGCGTATGPPCTTGTQDREGAFCASAGRIQVAVRTWRVRRLLLATRQELEVRAAVVIQAAGRCLLARARRARAEIGRERQELPLFVRTTQVGEREQTHCFAMQELAESPTEGWDSRWRRAGSVEQPGTLGLRGRWWTGGRQEAMALSTEFVDADRTGGDGCTGVMQEASAQGMGDEPSWLREAEQMLWLSVAGEVGEGPTFPRGSGSEASGAAPRRSGGRQRRQRRLLQQQWRRSEERLAAQEYKSAVRAQVERELQKYTAQVAAAGEEAHAIAEVLAGQLERLEPVSDRFEVQGTEEGVGTQERLRCGLELQIAKLEAVACVARNDSSTECRQVAAFEARCVAAGIVTGHREARAARLARLEAFLSQARSFRDERTA